MPNTLFLRLEGPLQSWGDSSPWSMRRTAPEPTKSGIVGLLACALGWADDIRIRALSTAIRVGIRCDLDGTPTPLKDWHTVGGGYSTPQLLTGEGKPKVSSGQPHIEVTIREYLCDASFLAAVRADGELLDRLSDAVQHPVWPLYLGRRSCPPSMPIFDGTGDHFTLSDALMAHPYRRWLGDPRPLRRRPRLVIEVDAGQGIGRRSQIVSRALRLFAPAYFDESLAASDLPVEYLGGGG